MKKLTLLLLLASSIAGAKQIPLKWKAIKGASSYKFEVANDKSFSEVIYSMGVKENGFDYETKSGIYYLRVQAVNNKGKGGKWSKPFKLVVTAPVKPFNENALNQEMNLEESGSSLPAKWVAPESKAPKYKVTLFKDGEEVEKKETATEDFEFKTKQPGNYEIVVQAGLDKYFGPPVTVKKYKLAKINFVSPRHQIVNKPNFSNKAPVEIKIPAAVPGKKYKLVLYKIDPRSPAGEKIPVATKMVDSPKADFGQLPPGRYVAAVENPNIKTDAPITEYNFNVRKAKPVEFQKVDLAFRYSFRQFEYDSTILEAGTSARANSFGGDIGFQGTMWFPDSNWGVRADGRFGNMLIEQSYLGINDLQLDTAYKTSLETWRTEFVFYAGARLWTLPVISKSNNGSTIVTEVYNPTFLGPVVGMDFLKPLGGKWSLIGNLELSQALTYTRFSEGAIFQSPDVQPNGKINLGARYAYNQHVGIVGTIGIQDDALSYTPNAANLHSGTGNMGTKTRLGLTSVNAIVGVEINDETSNFTDAPETHEKFSDLDFSMKYRAASLNYREHLQEIINNNRNGDVYFNNSMTSHLDFETVGFFTGSHHGFRMNAAWGGYSYLGATISYPEFIGQWAYRSSLAKKPGFQFKNYFGIRAWQLPVIQTGTIGAYASVNTELLGPNNRAQLTFRLSDTWTTNLKADISLPIIMANKPSYFDKLFPTYMSWRTSFDVTKEFNEDLSVTLEGGYFVDQLRYTAYGLPDSNSSTVIMNAPVGGISATYSF